MRTALQDAASIAGLLVTTEAMIADKPEEKDAAGGMPGGMPGGETLYSASGGGLILWAFLNYFLDAKRPICRQ